MSSWIKIRSHLANHPKVLRIACALKVHPSRVLGCLVYIWSVADMHADGECLPHMTTEVLDQMVDLPGLSNQLIQVEWMRVQEDGLYLPNYQEHNGTNAKRRALEAKRKGSVRNVSALDADNMRTTCGHDADIRRNECGHHAELDKSKSKSKRENTSSSLRSEEVGGVAETAPPPAAAEPPVAVVPTKGERKEWHLLASHIADWKAAYPGLDIEAEIRKALAWLNANPDKRRTFQGMPRFLVNWFNRATDRPAHQHPTIHKPPPAAPRPWSEVFAEQEQQQSKLIELEVRHG